MPQAAKAGMLYNTVDVSCTIVTDIGKGSSVKTNLPTTLLAELRVYQRTHNDPTISASFLDPMMINISFKNLKNPFYFRKYDGTTWFALQVYIPQRSMKVLFFKLISTCL